jgi:signal transduction histidine kinase
MDALRARELARQVIDEPAPPRVRDAAALAVAVLALIAGLSAFVGGRPSSGVWLEVGEDGWLVVSAVEPWSPAEGLTPYWVVLEFDGTPTFALPDNPDHVPSGEDLYVYGGMQPWSSLLVTDPSTARALELGATEYGADNYFFGSWIWASGNALSIGLAILVVAAWYLRTGRAGYTLQSLALPIAAATAVPLLVVPLDLLMPIGYPIATALAVAAGLVLADGLSTLVPDRATRARVRLAAFGIAAATVLVGFALTGESPPPNLLGMLRWAGLTLIPLVPAIAAARPLTPAALADGTSPSGRLVQSNELVFVGLTPGVAAFTMTFPSAYSEPFVLPILLWIAVLLAAARFTVRPLVRLATRANLQRDLVVAAMEAERARLAADLHDDALQDLTLLVRRLDAAGDTEGAAQARAVVDRLREICGDLRLPILDDLGVGPALDWLVLRIERLAGGEVRLERAEADRPPADVELAFFRVAQEALANAVKHGRPPIVVRYRASPSGASLSVDDAGTGIAPEAREEAATGGHFGLLNMQQRAEQIGAILDVRRWPAGGTHVALEWRAR